MSKKVFISGKMTGLPNYNEAGFAKAEAELFEAGFEPVSPWNPEDVIYNPPWGDCIIRALTLLNSCDAIYQLDGWEDSPGARMEWDFAKRAGIPRLETCRGRIA